MEGMFKDIDLSRDLMANYSAHLRDNRCEPGFFKQPRSKDVDVSVHVLTTGYWPAYPPNDVAVPAELADHMARFEDYYMAKYQGRRVAWQHGLGYCILKTRFASGRKCACGSSTALHLLRYCAGNSVTCADTRTVAASANTATALLCGLCVCAQQELDVSQLQATVLLLCFGTVNAASATAGASEEAAVPLSEIKAKTQIEDGELR
eukprot:17126-Heterococcus_DN1.PRE.1